MKKLIAISVVFALVAGAVFAADVSGEVFANVTPLQGDTREDSKVMASGDMTRIRVEISGQDDDGVFGGYIRMDRSPYWTGDIKKPDYSAATGDHLPDTLATITGNVWWKPVEQFKFLIGGNGKDGFFGADGITRWAYYQVAADGVSVPKEEWRFGSSFYQGIDYLYQAVFTITPIEPLEINIGIPFFDRVQDNSDDKNVNETADKFMKSHVQVAYTIDGLGKLAVTYKGDLNDKVDVDPTAHTASANGSKVFGYFNLTAIENLSVDIGLGYTFSVTDEQSDFKYNAPVAAGLGVKYDMDSFGIKARFQGEFAETGKAKGAKEEKGPMVIVGDVMPYFAVSDKITAFLDVGMVYTKPDKGDAVTGWHVEPYLTVKSSWWAPSFYAGVRIDSTGNKGYDTNNQGGSFAPAKHKDDTYINWSVPIGMAVHF